MRNKKILLANNLLLIALLAFTLIPIMASRLLKLHGSISGNTSLMLSGGTTIVVLGGIAFFYCRITKRRFSKVMVIKKISIKQVFLIMSVAVGTYIFAVGINSISMKLFPIVIKDSSVISKLLSSSSTLLGLFVVILIPAFFEEVFFRGIFLDAYEGLNKKMKYFIITSIFATFHGNVMQIIYVMFLGYILLKVREYTGSLVGSMTLHATNNAISFIISKVVMNYMNLNNTGIGKGVIDSSNAAATAQAMNVSFTVAILRASIFFLIGGAILFTNLRELKEYKEELNREQPVVKDEKITIANKKQYIPLVIYFVSMTILIVLKYNL
ncbi:MAG TPA: CPBP family intramembrane glutamic endopeptidase [Clostridium sp.]|uniref:CPBP family intramembrane glutamic endopeptidase n=1 Tax=Clostridium sp. TaxID=1506 RepID=UPI002F920D03